MAVTYDNVKIYEYTNN